VLEPDVALTSEELDWLHQIRSVAAQRDGWGALAEAMKRLGESILLRGVVPSARLAYFTDPDFNPGRRGKSRKDGFEENGTEGDAILQHPNFLPHLLYFVCGPGLDPVVVQTFREKADFSGHLTGSDVNELAPYARKHVRDSGLDPVQASDQFFKLAIEFGAMPAFADSIRKSVLNVQRR